MKSKILIAAAMLFCCSMYLSMHAQSCDAYYPLANGTSFEITSYDKKNKVESVKQYRISDHKATGGEESALIHVIVTDSHGKETVNTSYDIICKDGVVSMDINSMVSKQLSSNLENPDIHVEVTGTNLTIPNNLEKGQQLEDSVMDMTVSNSSLDMKFGVRTYERVVVGEESITTPAGTFDCKVIEYKTKVKMMITKNTHSKQWIAKGVGVVQQEEYSKKGKLMSKEVLTKFSN